MKTVRITDYESKEIDPENYISFDSIPHLCHIETTYACNGKCLFCYNPSRSQKINLNIIDQIVKNIAESQIPHVYLIGGEPSLLGTKKLNEYIEILSDYSSVTIVTNGIIKLDGLSNKLACIGIPLHGKNQETHEFLNQVPGSFPAITENIKHYVSQGFDVRCIPVLSGYNHNQIYDIIGLAESLGMESIFVDRYEDGGVGAKQSDKYHLRPTLEQFRIALGQMIKARDDFKGLKGKVGFGTAIPFCLDSRLLEHNMTCDCGVGDYFAAINPDGEVRMCNQSQLSFGNILEEPIEKIWQKKNLDIFRDLSWVTEPCKSCKLLNDCRCGCKVDTNCSNEFCIDYAVRHENIDKKFISNHETKKNVITTPPSLQTNRFFKINKYTKLILKYDDKFLKTRYQTVKLNDQALAMFNTIIKNHIESEIDLVKLFQDEVEKDDIGFFVDQLFKIEALDSI